MEKTVRLGTVQINNAPANVYCKIKIDNGNLSISGVEGPTRNGNASGSCGQIDIHLRDAIDSISPAPNWTPAMLRQFFSVWQRWHLNDMRAGTPAQMAHLATLKAPGYPVSYYEWACKMLNEAGLNPDNGYKYGSAWLREKLPQDVVAFLQSLPDTDKTPAWV